MRSSASGRPAPLCSADGRSGAGSLRGGRTASPPRGGRVESPRGDRVSLRGGTMSRGGISGRMAGPPLRIRGGGAPSRSGSRSPLRSPPRPRRLAPPREPRVRRRGASPSSTCASPAGGSASRSTAAAPSGTCSIGSEATISGSAATVSSAFARERGPRPRRPRRGVAGASSADAGSADCFDYGLWCSHGVVSATAVSGSAAGAFRLRVRRAGALGVSSVVGSGAAGCPSAPPRERFKNDSHSEMVWYHLWGIVVKT